MASKWQQEYADALDAIEKKRAAGTMTEGEAAAWRQRLLSEMDGKMRPSCWAGASRILLGVIVLIVILFIGYLVTRMR